MVVGFAEGVRGECPGRERGEWREEKWEGEVRLMGEKFESEEPLGVGGDLMVGYG